MASSPIQLLRPLFILLCAAAFSLAPAVVAAPDPTAILETRQSKRQELEKIESALIDKISRGNKVPDKEISNLVDDWIKFDFINSINVQKSEQYAESQNAIQRLMPLLRGNLDLQSKLKWSSATLFANSGQPEKSIAVYKEALSDINSLKYDIDYRYQNMLMGLGGAYMSTKNMAEADAIFSKVASYPWYSAPEPYFQDFRGLYENSLLALINTRRHNIVLLKRIYLPPAFQREVGPQLEAALKEAGEE